MFSLNWWMLFHWKDMPHLTSLILWAYLHFFPFLQISILPCIIFLNNEWVYLTSFFSDLLGLFWPFWPFLEENFPIVELLGIGEKYTVKIFSIKVESIYILVGSLRRCSLPYFLAVSGNINYLYPWLSDTWKKSPS